MVWEVASAFVLSWLLLKLLIARCKRLRLVDTPNERSMHSSPKATSGGIGFMLAVLVTLAEFQTALVAEHLWLFAAIAVIFVLGIIDDVRNLAPRVKLAGILFAVALLVFDGHMITTLGTFAGVHVALPLWLAAGVTAFAVTGFTNALNLIDGVDGLAVSVSMVILGTLLIIGWQFDDALMIALASVTMAALAAFGWFNWPPARIFMGDTGALSLGFVISILAVQSVQYIEPTAILFIAAVPLLDTMIVMYRRLQRHNSIFKADNIHLHHLILMQKNDVNFTSISLSLMQVVLCMIGYTAIDRDALFNLVQFGIIFYIYFTFFDQRVKVRR